ncbi:hypothetical protein Tco_0483329 [Tanacetum coccineum]|uniref:Uncharacterized protein n=1 Tax=Tanacetum coccineum TaxID=301880 RepID=A0ABQ5HPB2_9ASTR
MNKFIDVGVAKNLKKPSQAPRGVSIGLKVGFKLAKQLYKVASKKPNVNTSGNKKDVEPTKEVAYPDDHDSEDEVDVVDNDTTCFMASESVGFGTNSLLEQWKDTYENADYDYNPYDDDMYEGQEIPDKIQSICDNLDITVQGRKKK